MGGHGRVRLPAEYLPDRVLGHGAYGLILHAQHACSHGGALVGVAIKRLRPFHFDVDLKALLRELSVLRHVSTASPHPNLLRLLDVCPPPPGPLCEWREVCLVLEAMEVRAQQQHRPCALPLRPRLRPSAALTPRRCPAASPAACFPLPSAVRPAPHPRLRAAALRRARALLHPPGEARQQGGRQAGRGGTRLAPPLLSPA